MPDVLFVGCGNIAGGFDAERSTTDWPLSHAGAYSRHGGFELSACVDPDATRRQEFMTRWGVSEGYPDIADIPEDRSFDVVSICSPTQFHLGDVKAVLMRKPRVIFCEKPLASNLADAEEIVAACDAAGVMLVVNYSRRWDADVRRLAGELAAGTWGAVRSVSGLYTKGIVNNGSHLVDLLHLLLGEVGVVGVGKPVFDGYSGDPSVAVMLESAAGVPVQLNRGDAGDYSVFELQIVTANGVIAMEDGGLNWRMRRVIDSPNFRGYRSLDPGSRSAGRLSEAMFAAIVEIHGLLREPGVPSSTGANALATQRLCEQIRALAIQH